MSPEEKEKLDLEIINLRKKNRWESFSPAIPLFASVVTVFGLLIGIYQFQSQQSFQLQKTINEQWRERSTMLQNQIRSDADELLRFSQERDPPLSRISFLLQDLNTIMASSVSDTQKGSDIFGGYTESLVKSFADQIADETDFTSDGKGVLLAATLIENLKSYGDYLKNHPNRLNFILYKYIRALRYLRDKNPGYFEAMTYNKDTEEYAVPPQFEKAESEAKLFDRFLDIRDGFLSHLKLSEGVAGPQAGEIANRSRREFQAALCNKGVSEQILGTYFEDEPCEE